MLGIWQASGRILSSISNGVGKVVNKLIKPFVASILMSSFVLSMDLMSIAASVYQVFQGVPPCTAIFNTFNVIFVLKALSAPIMGLKLEFNIPFAGSAQMMISGGYIQKLFKDEFMRLLSPMTAIPLGLGIIAGIAYVLRGLNLIHRGLAYLDDQRKLQKKMMALPDQEVHVHKQNKIVNNVKPTSIDLSPNRALSWSYSAARDVKKVSNIQVAHGQINQKSKSNNSKYQHKIRA